MGRNITNIENLLNIDRGVLVDLIARTYTKEDLKDILNIAFKPFIKVKNIFYIEDLAHEIIKSLLIDDDLEDYIYNMEITIEKSYKNRTSSYTAESNIHEILYLLFNDMYKLHSLSGFNPQILEYFSEDDVDLDVKNYLIGCGKVLMLSDKTKIPIDKNSIIDFCRNLNLNIKITDSEIFIENFEVILEDNIKVKYILSSMNNSKEFRYKSYQLLEDKNILLIGLPIEEHSKTFEFLSYNRVSNIEFSSKFIKKGDIDLYIIFKPMLYDYDLYENDLSYINYKNSLVINGETFKEFKDYLEFNNIPNNKH